MEKFDIYWYEQHFKDGFCQKESEEGVVTIMENHDVYTLFMEPHSPNMVCEIKTYDADTLLLKTEGKCLKHGGTQIGVWKTYNEYGDVVEEKDFEEGWNIGWDALLPRLEAHKINLNQISDIIRYLDEGDNEEKIKEDVVEEEETTQMDSEDVSLDSLYDSDEEIGFNETLKKENDDEDPFEFLKSFFGEDDEDVETNHSPRRYWVITAILGDRIKAEYTFDGDTGIKIWEDYKEI
jgi:hypothetical protein